MEHELKKGDVYTHFKGKRYEIVTLAKNSEDGSMMVVYKALYPPYEVFVRPQWSFVEELSPEDYPYSTQKHRFEKETISATAPDLSQTIPIEIDPGLQKFISADSYDGKIEVLKELEGHISEETFAIMFLSLDFPMQPGSAADHFKALVKRLETMSEFDGKDFR